MKNLFSKWYVWVLILIPVGFLVWYYVIRKRSNNTIPVITTTSPTTGINTSSTSNIITKSKPPADIIDAYSENGYQAWYSPSKSLYYVLDANGFIEYYGYTPEIADSTYIGIRRS